MANRLKDILVVSIEQAVAAPLATARLADAGARVIKIERPEGDFARGYDDHVKGESSWFIWLNRGKQSVVLDFKQADDAALLHRLIAKADIFVQNLAPGAASRAGFGSKELRRKNTNLITCDITGYGETGPYRDMKAYDFLIQCEAGIAAVTGTPDAPARVGVSACDISAGLNAHGAILEALYSRYTSGKGDSIKISLFDGMAEWMNVPLMHQTYGPGAPIRSGLRHTMIAPYGSYPVGLNSQIVIAIQNNREWQRFCEQVLRDPALTEDARFKSNALRILNRDALDSIIEKCFVEFEVTELSTTLFKSKIAFGRLNEVSDLVDHPQLRSTHVDTVRGPISLVPAPARFESDPSELGRVPALGEHTESVKKEFFV